MGKRVQFTENPCLSPNTQSVCVVKPEHQEASQLVCYKYDLGDFVTNIRLPKTSQHWISVSCSALATACAHFTFSSNERSKN